MKKLTLAEYMALEALQRAKASAKASLRVSAPQNAATGQESGKARVLEREIHAEIEAWLKSKGAYYVHSRMDIRTTTRRGVPDFLILWSGSFYAVEVKRPGQKLKMHQIGELCWIEREGGRVGIAHSLAEFKSILETP